MWPAQSGRLPVVHMADSHLRNAREWLLRVGRKEMGICYLMYNAAASSRSRTAVKHLMHSTARLRYLSVWFDRFGDELKRRGYRGEDSRDFIAANDPTAVGGRPSWRSRIAGSVNRLRYLLSAPKGDA